jgi:excinuclease ABC subunit C
MKKEDFAKKKLPDAPGVYFFLGSKKEILYIGKATSLQSRVRSYFSTDIEEKRSKMIAQMVDEAKTVEYTVSDSVLEALILESNLIRTHKPKYNSLSKDDKSFNHLIMTNEEFPRVLVIRNKDLTEKFAEEDILYHFGPFTSATLFKEALKIIRKLFRYYDSKVAIGAEKTKMARGQIDFNRQIGLYPEAGNKKEYLKTIRHIRLLFEGKKQVIIKELEKEMMQFAKLEEFEQAAIIKKKIYALQHIQDVALIKDENRIYRDEKSVRIEAYDIAHLGGQDMVGVMTVIEGGEPNKNEYRKFKIQSVTGSNDPAALKEVIERRLAHPEWPYPQILVVDGSTAQKNAAEHVLRKAGVSIPVVAVVKDERHKPVRLIAAKKLLAQHEHAILLANAESHRFAINYHKQKRDKRFLA